MGRPKRVDVGELVYHVLNRASARARLFDGPADYQQFEEVLAEAVARTSMRLLACCVMPNHWHVVLWPEHDGQLSRCMNRLGLTHTQRWHARRGSAGSGHLYQGRYKSFLVQQGRYKSFLVQDDEHLLAVCRYVERNPLRAGLVRRAATWRWSSLWRRERGDAISQSLLADWPVARPQNWRVRVGRDDWVSAWSRASASARPFARRVGRSAETTPDTVSPVEGRS